MTNCHIFDDGNCSATTEKLDTTLEMWHSVVIVSLVYSDHGGGSCWRVIRKCVIYMYSYVSSLRQRSWRFRRFAKFIPAELWMTTILIDRLNLLILFIVYCYSIAVVTLVQLRCEDMYSHRKYVAKL